MALLPKVAKGQDCLSEGLVFGSAIVLLAALLADNLLEDPVAMGRVRQVPVAVGGSVYHPPEVPQLIDEYLDQVLDTAAAIKDPLEQAFFVSVHIPYLQPFEDCTRLPSKTTSTVLYRLIPRMSIATTFWRHQCC